MKEFMMKMVPLAPSDRFPFKCRMCGTCCRHVRGSVPLESLDVFRLAKYLRDKGENVGGMEDVLAAYAFPVLISENGYTAFMLKTAGTDDACVFLKDNRCTVHPAKPRACRTYPIVVGPHGLGGYEQYLSMEQPHHYKGPQMSVKKWIQRYCSRQDFEFLNMDIGLAQKIERLLQKIPQRKRRRALAMFLFYKYYGFDLDKPFIDQFRRNTEGLLHELCKMVEEPKEN